LNIWTAIQNKHEEKLNQLRRDKEQGNSLSAEDAQILEFDDQSEDTYKKDKLFIETGEDVEDIFAALKAYKLA